MEALRQAIQRYLANHETVEPVFYTLVEHEVTEMVLAREISQQEANELMEMVA